MARDYSVSGQGPRLEWKRNEGGRKRSIEEAIEIANASGVQIPDDVSFVEADAGDLRGSLAVLFAGGEMETARGPAVTEQSDGYVYWKHHYNRFGKICFRIHPDVLTSDEAIVGTFEHETFELAQLRAVFLQSKERRMSGTDYGLQVAVGYPNNFHDEAWDAADKAVQRMREAKQ